LALVEHSRGVDITVSEASVADYVALLKPRVMSLVVFTALVGMLLAPGGIHPVIGLISIVCIAIGAGASGALNMWYDADIDALMTRTRNRPVPSGRLHRNEALATGLLLTAFAVPTLGLAANWVAAGLLAFTIFFYAVIYTMWLKRLTPQNIVIGGAAGAFPPLIGWAAVTGAVSVDSLALFLIIFLWTPPHFWALALYKKGDYESAGIPMMPNVAGDRATRTQIVVYAVLLAAASLIPLATGLASTLYAVAAAGLGIVFVTLCIRLARAEDVEMRRRARQLFAFSLFYLFALFAALPVDAFVTRLAGNA